ncbi:DUF5050 domain-containing protein [Paenibacillus piscarius]|uniref:DUF5050 domain-containing protein n=1 Tax=Paenibacillus piscarius TaxID=1089681 RepID=UPI001EE94825|nr:DUF5050 domain-containing protein [Paenibacillus piscarius]
MNDNIAGGGLLLQTPGAFYITDLCGTLEPEPGTYLLNRDEGGAERLPGILWFMNEAGGMLFASDQSRGSVLVRVDTGTQELKVVLQEACRELRLRAGWLYYINEKDERLYRCLPDGRKPERLTDSAVQCYTILGEQLYYACAQGIYSYPMDGNRSTRLIEGGAAYLQTCGARLLYADLTNGHVLTLLDPLSGEREAYPDLIPLSMVSEGGFIYCCNAGNDGSIYRLDLKSGESLRIYGERADRIHKVDGQLFFNHQESWYTMPMSGGQAVRFQADRYR